MAEQKCPCGVTISTYLALLTALLGDIIYKTIGTSPRIYGFVESFHFLLFVYILILSILSDLTKRNYTNNFHWRLSSQKSESLLWLYNLRKLG